MRTNWTRLLLLGVLVGGLVAVAAAGADEPPPVTARDLRTAQNNLKQIAIAFHNYASSYRDKLPSDIVDKSGKPILSWRVVILPYVEENRLYTEFKLDEPWDSDHNKKLIERMPKVYAPLRVKAKPGETFYQTFAGKNALFDSHKAMFNISNMPDGTSNTGLVFEAGEPVVWSKPADLPFDETKPLPKLGGLFDGECNVAMCDGSVLRLKKDADEKELKNLIMPADGNVLDLKKLRK
jgi:prepilin-type processing-associated H-X9-DG protein